MNATMLFGPSLAEAVEASGKAVLVGCVLQTATNLIGLRPVWRDMGFHLSLPVLARAPPCQQLGLKLASPT